MEHVIRVLSPFLSTLGGGGALRNAAHAAAEARQAADDVDRCLAQLRCVVTPPSSPAVATPPLAA